MEQSAQPPGFELADALPGHVETAADFLQGVVLALHQIETQFEQLVLTLGEGSQGMLRLFMQHLHTMSTLSSPGCN